MFQYSSVILCKGGIAAKSASGTSKIYTSEQTFHKAFNVADVTYGESGKTYSMITPRTGEEFSVMQIPESVRAFNGVLEKPFNALILSYSNLKIVGWIDHTEAVVSNGTSESCSIAWHVDYWLTEQINSSLTVSFLEGRVIRGPASVARPSGIAPRYWKNNFEKEIWNSNSTGAPWTIILFQKTIATSDTESKTQIWLRYWPINSTMTGPDGQGGKGVYNALQPDLIYSGMTEESLGLNPESVIAIYFSPIRPDNGSGATFGHYGSYGFYETEAGQTSLSQWQDLDSQFIKGSPTSDIQKFVFVDPYGVVYGTVPWGLSIVNLRAKLDIGTVGAYLIIDYGDENGNTAGMGTTVQIPLISAPVTSNAMSSYVLSGQREYDIYTAQLQAEQNRKSGIANAGTSALSGAVGGAVAGGGIGAAAGAIAGLATSLLSTQANYQLTLEYNSKTQKANDQLISNQTSNILISGGGVSWFENPDWKIVKLVPDDQSLLEIQNDSELGYSCDYFENDCSGLIAGGGGLRIESLHVEGLNSKGNQYIQTIFSKGCYIDIL